MNDFDTIVVGGGLVGAAQALAFGQAGLRTALVEQAWPAALENMGWDARIYAITPGNAAFLARLGVWDALDIERIAPVHGMAVYGDDTDACLRFDPYEIGLAQLGCIAESRLLLAGLWQALQQQDNVELVCPAQCLRMNLTEAGADLELQDGRRLQAELLVGADGSVSWVRKQAGIDVTVLPYRQLGVVANFETEKAHGNIARQWFLPEGILAWLPLPGNRISIVWSLFESQAHALLRLDADAFCESVAQAGRCELGSLRLIAPPSAFPLKLQHNAAMTAPHLALIGDAAHQVHPLAGQGVNLGFRDVQELTQILANRGHRALGDVLLLRRYERTRQADILAMQAATTGLQKLFNNHDPLLGLLRNAGLALTDRFAPLKRRLMAHAIA